jgi:membrane fusion protein (multidrug efflux system)
MKLKYIFVVITLIMSVFLLTGCPGRGDGSAGDANETAESIFAVNVTPAIRGQINDYIDLNGDVETTSSVDIFATTAGEVVRLHARVGQRVAADQLIAEVDPSRPGQTFALSPVRSPISGTLTRLPARVGSQVNPSMPVAQVSQTDDLEITVSVAERFISQIQEGLSAMVRLDAFPGERFPATVTELNPVVDPLTRTLEVRLRFDQADRRIRAGMFAEVRLITESREDIVKVPADVRIRRFGEDFVFVLTEDEEGTARVERRRVTPGILIDNILEVTEGLAAQEMVVYQGQTLLENGVRVRVINTLNILEEEGN